MGLIAAVIVGIVGIVLALIINWIPVDDFLKIIPICWIPGIKCVKWYNDIKIYLIIILLAIVVYFIPIV